MPSPTLPAKPNAANVPAQAKPQAVLRDMLVRMQDQIAAALPKHITPERMIRVALTACQRVPKLLDCDPVSVVGAVVQAAELGLELSGPLGQAYLIPRWNSKTRKHEATFQVGYKGLLSLAYRSADVISFQTGVVREADFFGYELGTNSHLLHKPALRDRGEVTHVYAVVKVRSGGALFEVMSREDVEKHRQRFSQASDSGPWVTSWEEMARKTVARRLAKWAPLSVECQTAAALDEYGEVGADQGIPRVEFATADRAALLRQRLEQATVPDVAAHGPVVVPEGVEPNVYSEEVAEQARQSETEAKKAFGDAAERQPGEEG